MMLCCGLRSRYICDTAVPGYPVAAFLTKCRACILLAFEIACILLAFEITSVALLVFLCLVVVAVFLCLAVVAGDPRSYHGNGMLDLASGVWLSAGVHCVELSLRKLRFHAWSVGRHNHAAKKKVVHYFDVMHHASSDAIYYDGRTHAKNVTSQLPRYLEVP